MWIPKALLSVLQVNGDVVKQLQSDTAALRIERDLLRAELIKSQINSDWFRLKVNSLEFERAGLLEKAYGIKTPAPQIERSQPIDPANDPSNFSFEDVGNDMAKKLGLPIWGEN